MKYEPRERYISYAEGERLLDEAFGRDATEGRGAPPISSTPGTANHAVR
jgi:hypothetical protein